jgi:small nuclear ribonucleoprotein (snRNP)-like protein
MLEEFLQQTVVVDLRGPFVCLGTLTAFDDTFLVLTDADFHDFRDTATSRENYVAAAKDTGIKINRKRVLLVRGDVAAIARLKDVVEA